MITWKRGIGALVTVLALAGCSWGVTGPALEIGDTGARLTGTADRTEPGPITSWFEYGLTTAYSSSTQRADQSITGPVSLDSFVGDLAPSTIYHYRLCAKDWEKDAGVCGADAVFTTQPARDHVSGSVEFAQVGQRPLHVGISVDASTAANGADPKGTFHYYDDDLSFFGAVTCMRFAGNRATVGYTTPEGPGLVFINDNGPTGDSWTIGGLVNPAVCPAPPAGPYSQPSNWGNINLVDIP